MAESKNQFWYVVSLAFQLGFSLAAPLVICLGLGVYFDSRFDSSPRFTVLGIVIGFLISGYTLYTDLKPLVSSGQPQKKAGKDRGK